MKRVAPSAAALLLIASFGCAEESRSSSRSSTQASEEPQAEPTSESSESPKVGPVELILAGETLTVPATANIYGAGLEEPPSPGGGGGGTMPPGWQLPKGSTHTVRFASKGKVTPIEGTAPLNGPNGTRAYETSVVATGGISGIKHKTLQMFLVGVFLTDAPPGESEPPRTLDFTKPLPSNLLAPRIGQVFFIGDGKRYRYLVPKRATRLYVGFADGFFGGGSPGYYSNNAGELVVTMSPAEG